MKTLQLIPLIVFFASTSLTACTPNISPDVVSASNANQVQDAVEGVVVSKRNVTVKPDNTAVGTLTGAGLGALGGAQIGGGSTRYATGLIGAVTGGIAGNVIQEKLTSHQAVEYIIKLEQQDSGSTFIKTTGYKSSLINISQKSATNRYVTVIQAQGDQMINVGQKVMISGIDSKHAHIIGEK